MFIATSVSSNMWQIATRITKDLSGKPPVRESQALGCAMVHVGANFDKKRCCVVRTHTNEALITRRATRVARLHDSYGVWQWSILAPESLVF